MKQSKAVEAMKIVHVYKVAPSASLHSRAASTCPNSQLPLTFFDVFCLRVPHVQHLFFYEFLKTTPFHHSSDDDHHHIIPRLEHSLSLTLQHFLPLTGSLTWPNSSNKPVLNYAEGGGDAVSFTVAESDADFYRLSSSSSGENYYHVTEHHPLLPTLEVSHERAAVLALQVTLFPNCGFSIGITTHHGVLDAKAIHLFLKAWAYICCRSGQHYTLPLELTPLYDRSVVHDPVGLEAIYSKQLLDLDRGPNNRSLLCWEFDEASPDVVRGTFQLTVENIEQLRQLMKTEMAKTNEQLHLSTFCLACAYVWVCLVKAGEINDNKNMVLSFPVDFRPRLEPQVPSSYFGNCVGGKVVYATTKDLVGKDGLVVAVNAIGEAITSLHNKNEVLNGAEGSLIPYMLMSFWHGAKGGSYSIAGWVVKVLMSFWDGSSSSAGSSFSLLGWVLKVVMSFWYKRALAGRMYGVAGSPRFEAYSCDFGWGRPRKVDWIFTNLGNSTIPMSFCDTRIGDGGVEIGLLLKKQRMEAFASLFAQGLRSHYDHIR
ncbi:phenolic glucoside malonyltransferase 2-like [Humulus lupulus]|uniref:phenolic glucoside malonyltransferase 2-like n=1 Tax=Humulus lupulus TaxID=3486 RepID=UPI002B412763|nr:phenolic glucoside malonyltransferase 2-like [Humulus lupulus]